MTKRRVQEIAIEKLAHGGDGLAHLSDGRVLFVKGGVPGDVVDVEIQKEKKTWARGEVIEVREPSEARIESQCKAFDRGCGGCQFWNVSYEHELEWKVGAAFETMKRISGVDLPEPEIIKAPSVRDYRNRITIHQRRVDGELRSGFYASGSRQVVDIERCPVARRTIDEALAEFKGPLSMIGIADITLETAGDGNAVVLIELRPGERIEKDHLEEFSRRIEQGTVVRGVEILDDQGKYYVLGDTTVDAGEVLAEPPMEGMRIESGRFRQVNVEVNQRLVRHVTDIIADGWERPRVVELFCGAGNFSFPIAEHADSLVGFEGSEGAVATAREIAGLAEEKLDNMRFEIADLTDEELVAQALDEPFEVLLLDPPRQGAKEVAKQIATRDRAGQIIYVACDAACLARDTKTLAAAGWSVEKLTCFDMFPRTAHLETVAVLERGL